VTLSPWILSNSIRQSDAEARRPVVVARCDRSGSPDIFTSMQLASEIRNVCAENERGLAIWELMIGLGRKMRCDVFYIFPQIALLPCPLTYPPQLLARIPRSWFSLSRKVLVPGEIYHVRPLYTYVYGLCRLLLLILSAHNALRVIATTLNSPNNDGAVLAAWRRPFFPPFGKGFEYFGAIKRPNLIQLGQDPVGGAKLVECFLRWRNVRATEKTSEI